ncbi:MAG: hypothetical protein RR133_03225, partial [Kiritimatiellia bacterium]
CRDCAILHKYRFYSDVYMDLCRFGMELETVEVQATIGIGMREGRAATERWTHRLLLLLLVG